MNHILRISCPLALLLASISTAGAQNLVRNPNMTTECTPAGYAEITKATSWSNANGATVDLYTKNTSKNCHAQNDIPSNYMGHQASATEAGNYAGIIAFYDDGNNNATDSMRSATFGLKDGYKKFSEYLQGELTEPMIAGKIYQVSFKVSLGENSGRAVNNLGILLTTAKTEQRSNSFLKEKPQFISYRVVTDSSRWVKFSGSYIATGGERYITIGCFPDQYFEMQKMVSPSENDSRKAYYYLADISVSPYMAMPDMDAIITDVDYVELMDLQFISSSYEITPQFHNELNEVAVWMIQHPQMNFFIAGYADNTGTNAINDPLSVNRAREVKKYLVNKGVKEETLITEGYGSSNLIEAKLKSRQNRRVEIYFIN